MKKRYKIRAFTLLESLITLMLISIIISLSYGLINLIGKQLIVFEKENAEILEYNLFNSTYLNDLNAACNFSIENNKVRLDYYNTKYIEYSFFEDSIIRSNNGSKNLFKIEVISYDFEQGKNLIEYNKLDFNILNDTISSTYYFKSNNANKINDKIFNED